MDMIFGLPFHPLLVHLPVVLLPLGALAVMLLTAVPKLRRPLAMPTLGLLLVGAIGAFLAKASGEPLAGRVGMPETHASYGSWLPWLALAMLLLGGAWLWSVRRDETTDGRKTLVGIAASLLGVAVIVMTVVVGHSGATAAWGDVANPDPVVAESEDTITMADVESHATSEDCWAAIDGNAYDLTEWIGEHPGGADKIEPLCGTDATEVFHGMHDGADGPAAALERFLLGPVAD